MNQEAQSITVTPAKWPEQKDVIKSIRESVFVIEQSVDADLEWDGMDSECFHVLAFNQNDKAVATGRLQPDGKIGRMAVYQEFRNCGIGGQVLEALVEMARSQGMTRVYLHAQVHALAFYGRYNFVSYGEIYQEADIDHLSMARDLSPPDNMNIK